MAILTVRLKGNPSNRTIEGSDRRAFELARRSGARTQDATLLAAARKIAAVIIAALRADNKLLIIGNGGSAADAQHIAAEIIGRYKKDRPATLRSRSPPTPRR